MKSASRSSCPDSSVPVTPNLCVTLRRYHNVSTLSDQNHTANDRAYQAYRHLDTWRTRRVLFQFEILFIQTFASYMRSIAADELEYVSDCDFGLY